MTILYIVWSPTSGPLAAYVVPDLAYSHARTMVGVEVSECEVREQLPAIVQEDLESDFDGDDDTPVTEIPLDALEE